MRSSARVAALIELIEQVEVGIAERTAPADVIVGAYFRARRYAGSKDRRAITGFFYDMLRCREMLLWALGEVGVEVTPRTLVLAYFAIEKTDVADWFIEGDQYGPGAQLPEETEFCTKIWALDRESAPEAARANLPTWAEKSLRDRFGERWLDAAKALNVAAPLDLRVNTHKANQNLVTEFCAASEDFEKTPLSPLGMRSLKKIGLGAVPEYNQGQLEVQDEAAQIASMLVAAKPGMQVADMCAGAGGKSLQVSAQMENKGQLYAFDISAKRLRECKKRSDKSGCRNIQTHRLTEDTTEREDMLGGMVGTCDRVFVDAPCSGTGTWRRSPDQRWRLDEESVRSFADTQMALLQEASGLVREGGRLIYMTCSVLPEENEAVISKFLASSNGWQILNYQDVWQDAIGTDIPASDAMIEGTLQLSPHNHGTDGFFVTILERQ